jgi:hypothetical protein
MANRVILLALASGWRQQTSTGSVAGSFAVKPESTSELLRPIHNPDRRLGPSCVIVTVGPRQGGRETILKQL